MSAGGTILLAGLGGAAGAFAGAVAVERWAHRSYDPVTASAVGGAVGAALAVFVGLATTAVDAQQKSGTLSGPPPLRFP